MYVGPYNKSDSIKNLNNLVLTNIELFLDSDRGFSYSGSGSTWKDLSGNGRDVTLYNSGGGTYSTTTSGPPTHNKNRKNNEFVFDGTNDWGKFSSFNLGNTCTVSIWCKFTTTGRVGILSHCSGGPVNIAYTLVNGYMEYWNYDGAWQTYLGTTLVNTGGWKNLVWVKESTTSMKMYINGSLDATKTITNTTGPVCAICTMWGPCNSDSYGVGTDSYGSVFNGTLAQLMVHSTALTSTQVLQNYNNTKKRFGL